MKKEVAKALISSKALFFNTTDFFTWSSGIKSPIYCDNRVLISHVKEREVIANALADLIRTKYKNTEIIAATATGAIPHGAFVSHILQKPMLYILSKNKTHGRCKLIEGSFKKGQKVVVLEDLISTGGSSINAINSARDEGLEVLGCVSIFNYGFNVSYENFKNINCEVTSLLTLNELLEFCDFMSNDEKKVVDEWRKKFI